MTYSKKLLGRLRSRLQPAAQLQPPVGVLARLVVGRRGLDVTDIPHYSQLQRGECAITVDEDMSPMLAATADMPETERLPRMLPLIADMVEQAMDALAAGNRKAQRELDVLSSTIRRTLGYDNVLILGCGPYREYYELTGTPQDARAHLEGLTESLGEQDATGAYLREWIAQHPTCFGAGRGPEEAKFGPVRGLLARVVAGSTVMDRSLIHDCEFLRQCQADIVRHLAPKMQEYAVTFGDMSLATPSQFWPRIQLTTTCQTMDAEYPLDVHTRITQQSNGLALLDSLGYDNALLIQSDVDEQIEILGHPFDAYYASLSLNADLKAVVDIADVHAWIDGHPELFVRRSCIPRF